MKTTFVYWVMVTEYISSKSLGKPSGEGIGGGVSTYYSNLKYAVEAINNHYKNNEHFIPLKYSTVHHHLDVKEGYSIKTTSGPNISCKINIRKFVVNPSTFEQATHGADFPSAK